MEAERKRKKQEKEEADKLAIMQKDLNETEKERLLKDHEDSMKKFEDNLKSEQERTKEALRKKLEERRKKKKSVEMGKIRDEYAGGAREAAQEEKKKLAALQTASAKALTSATPSLAAKQIKDEKAPEQESLSQSVPPTLSPLTPTTGNVGEQDWMKMLTASPLFKAVNDIEEMIKDGVGPQGCIGAKGRPYIDIKDAQWSCQDELIPVDINELTPMQFVVYRFGVFIIQLLQEIMEVPEVTLLIASSLPPNNYAKNAFRNSFFYERSRKILFVRQERMDSVGDFVVLVMHCLAHIKVDDLKDDNNVLFLREFYKTMRVCCQDMFFSRSRSTPSGHQLLNIPASRDQSRMLGTPLEHMFKKAQKQSQKLNAVKELLDVKIKDPIEQDFSNEGVTERISKHNVFVDNAKLRAYLRSVGAIETSEQADSHAEKRLKELTGKSRPSDKGRKSLRRSMSSRTALLSPQQLLDSQIQETNNKIDQLNMELTVVLKSASDISKNIKNLESSGASVELLDRRRKKWEENNSRKLNLMKKIKQLETELNRKEKEKNTAAAS